MEQHRRNRIPGKIDSRAMTSVVELINYTTSANGGINVPTGVRDGDILVCISGNRNGSAAPPDGWTQVYYNDASSGEWNGCWYRVASSEPSSYTWTFTGLVALLMACFRNVNVKTSQNWAANLEKAPSVTGVAGGILISSAYSAADAKNMVGFTGMTTVGTSYNATNVRLMMAYKLLDTDGPTTQYVMDPTGITFDGYGSVSFER